MTNRTFAQEKASMQTALDTLATGGSATVAEALWGRKQASTGFPFIRFFIASVDSFHVAQNDYRRALGFQIDIVQELSQKEEGQAETELGNALYALFDLLEDQWDLSGNVIDDPTSSTSERTDESGRVVTASVIAKPRNFRSY